MLVPAGLLVPTLADAADSLDISLHMHCKQHGHAGAHARTQVECLAEQEGNLKTLTFSAPQQAASEAVPAQNSKAFTCICMHLT